MHLDLIIEKSKRLEQLLKELGCTGRGLHQLLDVAASSISQDVLAACRKVATIRNKAVHEQSFVLSEDQLANFVRSADFAIDRLEKIDSVCSKSSARVKTPAIEEKALVDRSAKIERSNIIHPPKANARRKFKAALILIANFADSWIHKSIR